jgi:CheY-like chemotaxis protein
MSGDRERCLEAGMDGYVAKPFVMEELFTTIESTLAGRRERTRRRAFSAR